MLLLSLVHTDTGWGGGGGQGQGTRANIRDDSLMIYLHIYFLYQSCSESASIERINRENSLLTYTDTKFVFFKNIAVQLCKAANDNVQVSSAFIFSIKILIIINIENN